MKTIVSCITLGLVAWSASAQQIQPYPNYPGSGQVRPGGNLQVLPYGSQPTSRPAVRSSTGYSVAPYPNQRQYPNNRQPNYNYNNRFPNQQGQNYNTGGNRNYGNNNRFPNQNGQYGNNNRFPSQTVRPPGNYGNSSARVVVPWWFTGQFNTALPHIRQQRPTQNGYGNNYNQGGNQFPRNQYSNGYGNQNGNYARPQTGNQNGNQRPSYQRPAYGNGYNNPYNTGQRYRTMPSQVGIGVQPRVLR
jgi:hypothetical protein